MPAFPGLANTLSRTVEPLPTSPGESVGTPTVWVLTIGLVVGLLALDFVITRKPHEVSMREAVAWSAFYVAIPVGFGVWIWNTYGSERGLEYYTGYLVEKSLSIDNLFVFLILLTAFAVPRPLQQRVLLFGVIGALVLRGILIAVGAQLISTLTWAFLLFAAILAATAVKVLRDAMAPEHHQVVDIGSLRSVKVLRRFWPVTDDYEGARLSVVRDGRRWFTPMALVIAAIFGTDVVFAIDSVPAVYGITGDPYLVFATNAFALLGLRALYFVIEGALANLAHLAFGLGAILAFISIKLALHWAHTVWVWVPEIPTLFSLAVILGILTTVILTSLATNRRNEHASEAAELPVHESADRLPKERS